VTAAGNRIQDTAVIAHLAEQDLLRQGFTRT